VWCADVDEIDIGIVVAFGVRAVDCGIEVWEEGFREGLAFLEGGATDCLDYVRSFCISSKDNQIFNNLDRDPASAYDSPAECWEGCHCCAVGVALLGGMEEQKGSRGMELIQKLTMREE